MKKNKTNGKFKKFIVLLCLAFLAFGSWRAIKKAGIELTDIIKIFISVRTETPINIKYEHNILYWDHIYTQEEIIYNIKCGNEVFITKDNKYDFSNVMKPGIYDIKLTATCKSKKDSEAIVLYDCEIYDKEKLEKVKNEAVKKELKDIIAQEIQVVAEPYLFTVNEDKTITVFAECQDSNTYTTFSKYIIYLPEYCDMNNIKNYIILSECEEVFRSRVRNDYSNLIEFDYDKVVSLTGNLLILFQNGYDVEKINEYFGFIDYDEKLKEIYATYAVFAKCTKGDEIKYVYQVCEIKANCEVFIGQDEFYCEFFNEGKYKNSLCQTIYEDFESPDYVLSTTQEN